MLTVSCFLAFLVAQTKSKECTDCIIDNNANHCKAEKLSSEYKSCVVPILLTTLELFHLQLLLWSLFLSALPGVYVHYKILLSVLHAMSNSVPFTNKILFLPSLKNRACWYNLPPWHKKLYLSTGKESTLIFILSVDCVIHAEHG